MAGFASLPYSFMRSDGETAQPGRGRPELTPGLSITGLCLRPRSRGSVAVRSSDFKDPPIVQANWLAEEHDRRALVASVRSVRALVARPALQPYVGAETLPGAACRDDASFIDNLKFQRSSGLHGTGTCRMGQPDNSVIGARLQVHEIANLRVVDCSVMPTAISANTHGPAMAVAVRAGELILEDRNADDQPTVLQQAVGTARV